MKIVTDQKKPRAIYRIVDTIPTDAKRPYSLVDPSGTVLDLDSSTARLASLAFDRHGADEVDHVYLTLRQGQL